MPRSFWSSISLRLSTALNKKRIGEYIKALKPSASFFARGSVIRKYTVASSILDLCLRIVPWCISMHINHRITILWILNYHFFHSFCPFGTFLNLNFYFLYHAYSDCLCVCKSFYIFNICQLIEIVNWGKICNIHINVNGRAVLASLQKIIRHLLVSSSAISFMKYIQLWIFLIIIISLVWLGHIGTYYAIKSSFMLSLWQEQTLAWILAWLSVSFIVMSMIVKYVYHPIVSAVYTISAVRLGTVYRLFCAGVVIYILTWVNNLSWWVIPVAEIGKILLVIALWVSAYGVRNSNQTKIVNYTVPMENLPTSWEGKKIAMIADTHVWAVRNIWLLHRIRPQIEWQWVELLLVAGDFYDGVKWNDNALALALADIRTPYGIYFAPGNHEEYNNLNRYLENLMQAWIHVLNNQVLTVDGIQIIGVDYSSTHSTTGFISIMDKLTRDRSQPSILIKHIPSHVEIVDQFGIDLQAAWHVHQWQVWPGYWFARRVFGAFSYGLNQIGQSRVITTSGVGTRWPPQRVGTQSEIIIITLTKK